MKANLRLTALVVLLAGAALTLIFPGFFGPYDPEAQDRDLPYAPPARLHWFDTAGKFHLRPFVYALAPRESAERSYVEDTTHRYPVRFMVSGARYGVVGPLHSRVHLLGVDAPGTLFLMGTDGYGRDQLSRLLYGGQISLAAGALATALSLCLALVVGTVAGFYGGRVDELLMRTSELFFALPWLYLLLAVRAVMPLHIEPKVAFLLVAGIIGMVGWACPARIVRGIVLSARQRNYVLAARGFGASDWYLLRRHLLPETYGVLLTQAALLLPHYILAEVTLSFLGLGVSEPVPSWGNMLGSAQHYHVLVSYWWMLAPALVLVPLFLICQRIADLLQSRFNPAA